MPVDEATDPTASEPGETAHGGSANDDRGSDAIGAGSGIAAAGAGVSDVGAADGSSEDAVPTQAADPGVDEWAISVGAAVDPAEIVGRGGFPLRIEPAAAIAPGTADARRLLVMWFIRKSWYWLFFVGMSVGLIAAAIRQEERKFDVDWMSPDSVEHAVFSPWVFVVFSLVIRVSINWIALGMTWPMVKAHEVGLSERTGFGHTIGLWLDRRNIAKAFRALRFSHHVRQVALGRVPRWWSSLDPTIDVVNWASFVVFFIVTAALGSNGVSN